MSTATSSRSFESTAPPRKQSHKTYSQSQFASVPAKKAETAAKAQEQDREVQAIVNKAWVQADGIKERRDKMRAHTTTKPQREAAAAAEAKEARELDMIVNSAWNKAEELKVRKKEEVERQKRKSSHQGTPHRTKKDDEVDKIVTAAWGRAEEIKEKKKEAIGRAKARHDKHEPLRRTNTDDEVDKIVSAAWGRAEEIKEKRKEAQERVLKQKKPPAKPRWNERQTSWNKADFGQVQALIENAWVASEESLTMSARKRKGMLDKIEEGQESPLKKQKVS